MATEVESLIVNLEARVDQFEKNMARAQRQAKTSSDSIGNSFAAVNSKVNRALGALGIGLSVTAIEEFIRRTIEAGSTVKDLSDKLGITAEQFQELSYAASQTSSNSDDVVAAFRGMANFLKGAAQGGKDQVAVLKSMGLSFDDIRKKSPVAVFEILLDRIGKIQNPTQRAAELATVFGKSAAGLGALSLLGAQGVEELRNKAHDVGAVMSNEVVNQLNDAGDKLDQLGKQANTAAGQLVANLTPAISSFVDLISDPKFQQGMKDFAEKLAQIIAFITAHPELISILAGAAVGGRVGGLPGAAIGGLLGAAGSGVPIMGPGNPAGGANPVPPSMRGIGGAAGDALRNADVAAAGANPFDIGGFQATATPPPPAAAAAVAPAMKAATTATNESADALKKWLDSFDNSSDDFSNFGSNLDEAAAKLTKVNKDLDFQTAQLRRTARDQEIYNALNEAGVTIDTKAGQAIAAKAGAFYDLKRATDENIAAMDTLKGVASDALTTIIDGFKQGQSAGEIFAHILEDVASKIESAGIDRLLRDLPAQLPGSGGLLSGILGFLFGGARASGGQVSAGKSYLVGERGMELFTPNVSGQITPQGNGAGGGSHLIELVLTPEMDARIKRVSGPQSQQIAVAVTRSSNTALQRRNEIAS